MARAPPMMFNTDQRPTNMPEPPISKKSLTSIIFPPAILGPEMAALILWAPGIFWFVLLENIHARKIPRFRGGGKLGCFLGGRGGVEVPILFLWARGFF